MRSEANNINKINESEFNILSSKIFNSFLIDKSSKLKSIESKDKLLNSFIDFLTKYIESDLLKSDKERNSFLNLIDKLTLQQELFKVRKQKLKNIQEAGLRLGRKSQSAFKSKVKT